MALSIRYYLVATSNNIVSLTLTLLSVLLDIRLIFGPAIDVVLLATCQPLIFWQYRKCDVTSLALGLTTHSTSGNGQLVFLT